MPLRNVQLLFHDISMVFPLSEVFVNAIEKVTIIISCHFNGIFLISFTLFAVPVFTGMCFMLLN